MIAFHHWAWTRVLDQAAQLSEEEYTSRQFNFGSVRSTLIHISSTENAYIARLKGEAPPSRRTEESVPDFASLRQAWEAQFEDQKAFAASLTDDLVSSNFTYQGANGQEVSFRRDLYLAQFINHATQHRSEAAVAITEFGHSPGDLDVTLFLRENPPLP
jgi:uncharacterized damage-inducible protein DinB